MHHIKEEKKCLKTVNGKSEKENPRALVRITQAQTTDIITQDVELNST